MRITGGFLKGRELLTPPSREREIRPLRTRIRKALFDILGHDLKGVRVLDLFAGTGALGIEALSRGAEFAVFVDNSPKSLSIIQKNLEKFQLTERAKVISLKIPEELPKLVSLVEAFNLAFELVFITPPYEKGLSVRTFISLPTSLLTPQAVIIVEERTSKFNLTDEKPNFVLFKTKIYGETSLYFFRYVT